MGHLVGDTTNKMLRDTHTLEMGYKECYFSSQLLKTNFTFWLCPAPHSPYRHIVYSTTVAEKNVTGNSNIEAYELAVVQRSTDNQPQFAAQRNYQHYGGSFEYQTIYSNVFAFTGIEYTFKILSQYPSLTVKYQVWNGAIKVWEITLPRYGNERGVTMAIQQLEFYGSEYHIMLDDIELSNTYWYINGSKVTDIYEAGIWGNKKFDFWYNASSDIWQGTTLIPAL